MHAAQVVHRAERREFRKFWTVHQSCPEALLDIRVLDPIVMGDGEYASCNELELP